MAANAVCPLCGVNAAHRYSVPCDWRKPKVPRTYMLYWCSECRYGFLWPRPTVAEVVSFYELDEYYTHSPESGSRDSRRTVSLMDRVRTHLAWRCDYSQEMDAASVIQRSGVPSPSVCEIGCGNGNVLKGFRDAGCEVFGVEPDQNARAAAAAVVGQVFPGTAEDLPREILTRQYDIVIMSHVLEHCLDVQLAVANVARILRRGGLFIVGTPNSESNGFALDQGMWPWADIPRHLNFFSAQSLRKIQELHGIRSVECYFHGFCRQVSPNWLNMEENIWTAFSLEKPTPKPSFRRRAWQLLLRSAFARPEKKYDSVWQIGVRQ